MENFRERITIDENICNGRPTIRGKRIAVNTILDFLSAGDTIEDILKQYPNLEEKDITACLRFAAEIMNNNFMIQPVA